MLCSRPRLSHWGWLSVCSRRICALVGKGSGSGTGQKPGNVDSLNDSHGECDWLQTKGQHRPASVCREGLFMSGTFEKIVNMDIP